MVFECGDLLVERYQLLCFMCLLAALLLLRASKTPHAYSSRSLGIVV